MGKSVAWNANKRLSLGCIAAKNEVQKMTKNELSDGLDYGMTCKSRCESIDDYRAFLFHFLRTVS